MSWSRSAEGTADEVKASVNEEQYCPDSVKEVIGKLIDECKGTHFNISTYGHHEDGKIANVSVTINSS